MGGINASRRVNEPPLGLSKRGRPLRLFSLGPKRLRRHDEGRGDGEAKGARDSPWKTTVSTEKILSQIPPQKFHLNCEPRQREGLCPFIRYIDVEGNRV